MPIAHCRLHAALPVFILIATGGFAIAQAPEPAAPNPGAPATDISTGPAVAGLRPALDRVGAAVAGLRIAHWKAPVDIRNNTEEDVASIQRDLGITLPPLLDQAQAAGSPGSALAPSFAVFRNIDALYDVMLRVTEMANLAGSASEAGQLEDARAALESARAQLANSLLASVHEQDTEIARLRSQKAAVVKPPPPPPPTKTVVDDGPAPVVRHHKKKPATTATPPSPAPQ